MLLLFACALARPPGNAAQANTAGRALLSLSKVEESRGMWMVPTKVRKASFRLPRLLAFDGIWGHQDGCLRRMRSRRCLFLQVHLSIWSCTCNIMITNVGFFEDLVNDHNTNTIIKLHLCVLRAYPEPLK